MGTIGLILILYIGNIHGQPLVDIDGNIYQTIQIGGQTWMQENLKVLHYPDGSAINNVSAYEDSDSLAAIYGMLYDWDAAMNYTTTEKAQGVCPDGWHIPSDDEWTQLANFLGGSAVAGGKMKESGTTHWSSPNVAATNESGFTALPAGEYDDTHYQLLSQYFVVWSSTQSNASFAKYRYLSYQDGELHPYNYYKSFRYSVRCLKNEAVGMNMHHTPGLKVYPNPVDYLIYFDQEAAILQQKEVTVYNHMGKKMMDFKLRTNHHVEDMGTLAAGIYFLKIEAHGQVNYKKIMKR